MNKLMLLITAATLTACGPSQPSETVDALVANPERIKGIQRQCKEDRAKVGDELCRRAAEAANRRFFGDRPEQKSK
ncbi:MULTISPECIES: EexN family lipoprotein [Pseudomonadota]|uniref:EexN family lipoprotein n=1 Tax=Pseudomonadota TaxID=1224 RepID=UPI002615D749|nr:MULTISPECIES: EexN family lipoprotein [Pseudomonadota]